MGFTGFYWVLLNLTGFYRVFTTKGITAIGITGFQLGFTGLYWVSESLTRSLLSFTEFYRVFLLDSVSNTSQHETNS